MFNTEDMEISPRDFANISYYVKQLCGLELKEEKMYLVRQRLQPLAQELGCTSFSQFYLHLQVADATLQEKVVQAMTTNETYFYRDVHPWDAFMRHILPQLAVSYINRREVTGPLPFSKLNIWCAASSTGQEPYTIAMCIDQFCQRFQGGDISPADFRIVATDIDNAALERAREGVYTRAEVERGIDAVQRERFFTDEGNHYYRVAGKLREMVDFRQLNLMEDFSANGMFDIIFCRNVLIYFDHKARKDIVRRMEKCLTTQGFLVIGTSENLHEVSRDFKVDKYGSSVFYKKQSCMGGVLQ